MSQCVTLPQRRSGAENGKSRQDPAWLTAMLFGTGALLALLATRAPEAEAPPEAYTTAIEIGPAVDLRVVHR